MKLQPEAALRPVRWAAVQRLLTLAAVCEPTAYLARTAVNDCKGAN